MALTPQDAIDRFLLRAMEAREYSSVRLTEPCFVEAGGSHPVRHVILTDKRVVLTENPPRKLALLLNLLDITAIDVVRDACTIRDLNSVCC